MPRRKRKNSKKKRTFINVSDDDRSGAESIATIGGSDFSCTDSDSDYLPPSNNQKQRPKSNKKKKTKKKSKSNNNNNNNSNNNNDDNAPKLTKEQQEKLDREREIETSDYYDREEDCVYERSVYNARKGDVDTSNQRMASLGCTPKTRRKNMRLAHEYLLRLVVINGYLYYVNANDGRLWNKSRKTVPPQKELFAELMRTWCRRWNQLRAAKIMKENKKMVYQHSHSSRRKNDQQRVQPLGNHVIHSVHHDNRRQCVACGRRRVQYICSLCTNHHGYELYFCFPDKAKYDNDEEMYEQSCWFSWHAHQYLIPKSNQNQNQNQNDDQN